jgi:hypothetical protein
MISQSRLPLPGCSGRPMAGRGPAAPRFRGESRAEHDAESEGDGGERHRDPGSGSPVTAVPGAHLLRCWHVLAVVEPAEHLQHRGEMRI